MNNTKINYPETYDYIYSLVEKDISETKVAQLQKRFIVIELLKEVPAEDASEAISANKYLLNKISRFLNRPSIDPTLAFHDFLIDHLYKENQDTIGKIFEAAEEEYLAETQSVSEQDDWIRQDNADRKKDFDTHFYTR